MSAPIDEIESEGGMKAIRREDMCNSARIDKGGVSVGYFTLGGKPACENY